MGICRDRPQRRHLSPGSKNTPKQLESLPHIDEGAESQILSRKNTFSRCVSFSPATVRKKNLDGLLIIDGGHQSLNYMSGWFSELGYAALTCASGAEANLLIQNLLGAEKNKFTRISNILLVICDLSIQYKGAPFLDYILQHKATKHIPVIATSIRGGVSIQSAERALKRGGQDFIYKPINKNILLRTVEYLISNNKLRKEIKRLKGEAVMRKREFKKRQREKNEILRYVQDNNVNNVTFMPETTSFIESTIEDSIVVHVMVIDDDYSQKKRLIKWLQHDKYRVTNCSNKEQAINLLRKLQPTLIDVPMDELLQGTKNDGTILPDGKNNSRRQSRVSCWNAEENKGYVDLVVYAIPSTELNRQLSLLKQIRDDIGNIPFIICSEDISTLDNIPVWDRNQISNFLTKPLSPFVHLRKITRICENILLKKSVNQLKERIRAYTEGAKNEKDIVKKLHEIYSSKDTPILKRTVSQIVSRAISQSRAKDNQEIKIAENHSHANTLSGFYNPSQREKNQFVRL